ncbi:type II toxin-antitoxin system VapC family toxin [Candidatus Woesearchaeota archaeon]|nr:type II toxin-antitoxin system VapC family toxin [Candidatus Woesearchaeota archaeon]
MIGLDSSSVIDFFKGDNSLKTALEKINEPLALNIIIYSEIMFGLDLSNVSYKKEEIFYDGFFDSFLIFELDRNSSKKSSEVLWHLKKTGKIIGLFDCTIAGIYLANGINKILTKNKKHFEKIKGIQVISY